MKSQKFAFGIQAMPSKPHRTVNRLFATCHRIYVERNIKDIAQKCSGSLLIVGSGYDPHSVYFTNCSQITRSDIGEFSDLVDVVCDVAALPFNNGEFDNVLASEVLEHVFAIDDALDEILRVLKPNGRLIITVPFLYHVHGDPNDFNRLTEQAWVNKLSPNFSISIKSIGNRLTVIFDLISQSFYGAQFIRLLSRLVCVVTVSKTRAPSGYVIEGIKNESLRGWTDMPRQAIS